VGCSGFWVAALDLSPANFYNDMHQIIPTQHAKYIPALDGMRAIAIAIVIASHYGAGSIVPGGFGVTLFFFISGFIITRTLAVEHLQKGTISVSRFYVRRFKRLCPALFFMIAPISAVYAIFVSKPNIPEIFAGSLYYMNYYIILGGIMTMPFEILWSLAVEEHYYLIYPSVFAASWKFPERFLLGIGILCFAVLAWRLILFYHFDATRQRTYFSTDTRIDSILLGAGLAIAMNTKLRLQYLADTPLFGMCVAALLFTFAYRSDAFRETFRYSIQSVAIIPIFYAVLFSERYFHFKEILSLPAMVWVGKLSYSLYLWHVGVSFFFIRLCGIGPRAYALSLLVTFLCAAFSYFVVERWYRKSRASRDSADVGAICPSRSERDSEKL
jgi:peptidoglycan/LPS O-acetylase OafA/YrhL